MRGIRGPEEVVGLVRLGTQEDPGNHKAGDQHPGKGPVAQASHLLHDGVKGGLVGDEAGVEENELIGGSALTIGEYLSPRLYLSYGVGLFEPGEVIALRYKLNKAVGVRIQRGTEETRAGIEYRIER